MTTAREQTTALIEYLRGLAPRFFAERMRGASSSEIDRVEQAAGTRLSDSHRAFLAALGMTPPQALNPFLTDRDYGVPALLRAYEEWSQTGESLPPGIVVFSNSDILGEYIFLRHEESLDLDPKVGDIRFETNEFMVKPEVHLLGYLRWFAFQFRLEQQHYMLEMRPDWDAVEERFRGDPETAWRLFLDLGLHPVFSLESGSRCANNGSLAAIVHTDGSGTIAGDNMKDLRRAQDLLHRHLDIQILDVPEHDRYRAPRE